MTFLLYAGGFALVWLLIAVSIDEIRLSRHQGMSHDAFVEAFHEDRIPAEIPSTVYDFYKPRNMLKNVGLNPWDSLDKVLGIVHEDIESDVEQLAERLNMELPIEAVLSEWEKPLDTLRDVVLWLDWIRQKQTTNTPL